MITLEELEKHHAVLGNLLESKCVCVNVPSGREEIAEAVSVANTMFAALITQLQSQSVSFTP